MFVKIRAHLMVRIAYTYILQFKKFKLAHIIVGPIASSLCSEPKTQQLGFYCKLLVYFIGDTKTQI